MYMEKQNSGIKLWQMALYALAPAGFSLLVGMNTYYTNYFLTDVAIIPLTLIATILLVVRVVDMIEVPIIAVILEKSNMRWGKYRSWLLVGAPLLAVFYTLIYTNINAGLEVKLALFIGAYIVAHIFVNLLYGALYALIPLMTKTNHERAQLSAMRVQFQSVATILYGYIAMPLLLAFTGNGAAKPGSMGFILTTGVFAVVMIATFLAAFMATKNFDLPRAKEVVAQKQVQKSNISSKELTKMLFKNPHILALITADTVRLVGTFGFSGVLAYYFIYVLNDVPALSIFMGSTGILLFAGSTLFPFICKKIDKRTMYMAGSLICVVFQFAAWAFSANTVSFVVMVALFYIGQAFANSASPAMFADATDFSELHFGKEGKGFLMSMANMPPKIALIITGSLTAAVLGVIGYKAGVASTPEIVGGIKNLAHFMPMFAYVAAFLIILFFNKLTINKVQEIQKEIQEKSRV